METKKYTSLNGLEIFLDNLRDLFATQESIFNIEEDTNLYILDVDYSALKFDTSEIVS